MPYLNVWIHLIWSTKNREPLLTEELRPKLFSHIRENAQKKGIHLEFINGHQEHIHTLISLHGDQTISNVARLLKGESSHWVNQNRFARGKFEWQDEYIAVSVSKSIIPKVKEYIAAQDQHHRKRTFMEEYQMFLQQYGFQNEKNTG